MPTLTLTIQNCVSHGGAVQSFSKNDITIGRRSFNIVVLRDEHISRRHGIIRWTMHCYAYTDLGSLNGSTVLRGGEHIIVGRGGRESLMLHHGDLLLLGNMEQPVCVSVEIGASSQMAAATADTEFQGKGRRPEMDDDDEDTAVPFRRVKSKS